jgi:hypothetical protein
VHLRIRGTHFSGFEISHARPVLPFGRGPWRKGKALGSEKDKVLGCELCYEETRGVRALVTMVKNVKLSM